MVFHQHIYMLHIKLTNMKTKDPSRTQPKALQHSKQMILELTCLYFIQQKKEMKKHTLRKDQYSDLEDSKEARVMALKPWALTKTVASFSQHAAILILYVPVGAEASIYVEMPSGATFLSNIIIRVVADATSNGGRHFTR